MATDNVAFITFEEEAKAFQALSVVRQLAAERKLDFRGGAVVSRGADGAIKIEETDARGIGGSTSTGGLVGALVGILGGPIGVLLGWGTGALVGGAIDAGHLRTRLGVLHRVGEMIPEGKNGLIAEVREEGFGALDAAVNRLGGTIVRSSTAAIEEEVEEARKEATRTETDERREEFTEKIKDTFEDLRSKLPGQHPDKPAS
jgi:uncharacterized membrane protein